MSGKDKPSKKAVQKKKDKVIEDQTFGLKNKNKSKKVQQFISRVETSVKNSGGGAEAARAREAKKENKMLKQLQDEELRQLFNEGISNQYGKKKTKAAESAAGLGVSEVNKEVAKFLEEMSSDSSDDEDKIDRQPTIYLDDEPVVAVEVFREKTIEDIIEEQRAKLAAEGKQGTPVTAESFAKWRAGKLAQRQAAAEARMKAEQTKRKGGKGLSVLSGKELFNYNASLFVDDDAALDAQEEDALNEDLKKQELLEEARMKEEADKAQAEQLRLAEVQRIEMEARKYREEARRVAARAKDRLTFVLNGVVINQVVFEEDDFEDLTPFSEETLVEMEVSEPQVIEAQDTEEGAGGDEDEDGDDDNDAMDEDDGEEGENDDEDNNDDDS